MEASRALAIVRGQVADLVGRGALRVVVASRQAVPRVRIAIVEIRASGPVGAAVPSLETDTSLTEIARQARVRAAPTEARVDLGVYAGGVALVQTIFANEITDARNTDRKCALREGTRGAGGPAGSDVEVRDAYAIAFMEV